MEATAVMAFKMPTSQYSECQRFQTSSHMGAATGQDKNAEKNKNETEGKIAALTDQPEERKRNGKIGERNQRVRDDVEPDQARIPQVTVAMGHEIAGTEYLP
jgi:hypothetical protein